MNLRKVERRIGFDYKSFHGLVPLNTFTANVAREVCQVSRGWPLDVTFFLWLFVIFTVVAFKHLLLSIDTILDIRFRQFLFTMCVCVCVCMWLYMVYIIWMEFFEGLSIDSPNSDLIVIHLRFFMTETGNRLESY